MTKEQQEKIASCKALQGKSVVDVVAMPEFQQNLAAYMKVQRTEREAARESYEKITKANPAVGRLMHLPAHPVDKCIGMTAEEFAAEYLCVINKRSDRPAAEREYIRQLGQQAFNLTIANFVVAEFPELKDIFFPTSKQN